MEFDLETKRQSVHLLSGVTFATIVYMLPMDLGLWFLAGMAILTLVVAKAIQSGWEIPIFSWLVKQTERKGKPPASGVTWYFVGVLAIFVVFGLWMGVAKQFIVASMLIVAIGDSICTGLGRKIGKSRLPRTKTKSYEGSITGFGAAFFGAAFVLNQIMPLEATMVVAFAGALVGMLTEAYLRGLDDNMTIPVLACVAMVAAAAVLGAL